MTPELLRRADELAQRRQPFVLATVVRRRVPSSGRPGAAAIVLADGTVEGWLGGACTGEALVQQARLAFDRGEPRLVAFSEVDDRSQAEDIEVVPMHCASEGALEVYLEPMLPRPQVVAVGGSPAAAALVGLARALDWPGVAVDDGRGDLSGLEVDDRTCIVVATQGHYDEAALEAALATPAAYVGLVASKRRAEDVLAQLRERGVPEERLGQVQAPAGVDLGSIASHEIAVAVLAELVARRAAGRLGTRIPGATETGTGHSCH